MRGLLAAVAVVLACAGPAVAGPDPSPGANAKATINDAPMAYVKRGFVVVIGRPTGYGPSAVVYRFWNPLHGG